jgi:3-deoxy-D-manno-octulosonic acid kinase
MPTPPDGYLLARAGVRTVFVRADATSTADEVGFVAGTPAAPPLASLVGRGHHGVFACAAGRVIWKRCRRGGLAARCLGDRYWGVGRFIRELAACERARRAAVPVADLLALAIVRGSLGSRRVEQLVSFVEGARDAAEWLAVGDLSAADRRAAAAETASLLRRFHDAGLRHGDLNLRNILLRRVDGRFAGTLIDLDPPPRLRRGARTREGNLLRLFRSFCRTASRRGIRFAATDRLRFLRAYAEDPAAARRLWRAAARAAARGGWLAPAGAR